MKRMDWLPIGALMMLIAAPGLSIEEAHSQITGEVHEVSAPKSSQTPVLEGDKSKLRPNPIISPSSAKAAELSDKSAKAKKRALKKEQKKELRQETEYLPILAEILKLKWEEAPQQGQSNDTKRIGLEKLFHETLDHSITVKQAEVQIKDAEAQAKEIRDPSLFNLLNPIDTPSLKKAAENNVKAAKAHLQAARQKALLESAKMYGDLTQAFLGKYLTYQAIEQGRSQLKEEQERFIAGETNHFDVTQTQMALVDRYGKYLNADNTYHAASMVLANQISAPIDTALIPEVGDLQDQNAMVPLLKLIPETLTLEEVLKAAKNRPDGQEIQYRRQALQGLIKAASGLDRQKKQAELHQLELEIEKAAGAGMVMAEKAYADYQLSQKNLILAQQQYALAYRFAYQMHVSHNAGFSSAKDVLDSQIELSKVKTALIGTQVTYNISQIQLLYEMGVLDAELLSRPPVMPPNIL